MTAKLIDVVAVGSWSNFDHLFVVDQLPAPGDTVQIQGESERVERVYWGGCAPNNAAAVARLGGSAALVSVVGHDFRSRGYQAYFETLHVNLDGTILVEDALCGHSFMFSDGAGATICISHLGIAQRQGEFKPAATILAGAKVAIVNYRFDRFTLQAAEIATQQGALVIASGALVTARDYAGKIVDAARVLVCNEHELDQLAAHLGMHYREQFFERGVESLIITRGKDGSTILTATSEEHIPAAAARQVVDPVGAGDGFVGGLALGLAWNWSASEAVRLGAVTASFVVEAWGAQTHLPSFEQSMERWQANFGAPPHPRQHI